MGKISRLNSLIELLSTSPGSVYKILIQKGRRQKKIREIILKAKQYRIPVYLVPKVVLDRLDDGHQGFVAVVGKKEYTSLEKILSGSSSPLLVILDSIEDPQNLGAIIRTAEGAGVDGIILPARRSAGLTDTVFHVSAGAVSHVDIARVTNLAQTLDRLKEAGLWLVGAEGGSSDYWFEFDYNLPTGLILGSEGKGLRPLVRKKCDKILSIPLLGRISSLNVSAAASIFIYEAVRQRMRRNE